MAGFSLSTNALQVLEARYLRRDMQGLIKESPDQMFERVAKAVAYAELLEGNAPDFWQEEFYRLLSSLDFLPNSPTLMNAGTELSQLSACFVLPVEDTMEGIFEAIKQMALIQRTGGGTGFSSCQPALFEKGQTSFEMAVERSALAGFSNPSSVSQALSLLPVLEQ